MQLTIAAPSYVCIDLYADTSPIIRHPIVEPNGDILLFGHPLQRVMHVDGLMVSCVGIGVIMKDLSLLLAEIKKARTRQAL